MSVKEPPMPENMYFVLDANNEAIPAKSRLEVEILLRDKERRTVAISHLPNGMIISTVFLGLNHNWGPPGSAAVLFETMVFPGPDDYGHIDIDRYSTWEEAKAGHDAMVGRYGEAEPA